MNLNDMSRMKSLIEEARTLATLVNTDRLSGVVPASETTVRLTEVTDLMMDICILDAEEARRLGPVFRATDRGIKSHRWILPELW